MLTTDAASYFGNFAKLARALKISRTTVWKWHHLKGGHIPASFAAQLHVMTDGKLPFDIEKYGERHD